MKYGRNFVKSPEGSYKVVHLYIHLVRGVLAIDSIDSIARPRRMELVLDGGALLGPLHPPPSFPSPFPFDRRGIRQHQPRNAAFSG